MNTKIITIRASLKLATKFDCFSRNEIPLENKLFFVKDTEKGIFKGIYKISGTERFTVNEVYQYICIGALFTLTADHCESNFCFKLLLRPADDFDFFYNQNNLKENKIYYFRNGDEVSGPYCMSTTAEHHKIRKAIESGKVYVPCNEQTMEPIAIQKTA